MPPTSALDTTAIDRVRIFGAKLTLEMREALVSANIDMSMDAVTQLSMVFSDPGFKLLGTGAVQIGTRVDFDDFRLQITNNETGEVEGSEGFTIKCRPQSVASLKARRGAKVMSNVSPSEFVIAECKALGVKYNVQPSTRRKQVARDIPQKGETYDEPPSSWTTFKRLASELGYVLFEAADTVYFARPSWILAKQLTILRVYYRYGEERYWTEDIPACVKSQDAKNTTVGIALPPSRAREAIPGNKADFRGVPLFNGYYLLNSAAWDLIDPAGTIDIGLTTPIDPEPNPPTTSSGTKSGTATSTRRGTKSAADFVYWAQKQLGDRYVFGAGPTASSSTNPTAFDCSGLVRWALSMVGITSFPRVSGDQINYCTSRGGQISVSSASRTRGALLWHPGHIAISLGNGKTIEAMNRRAGVASGNISGRFTKAAKIPGLKY